MRGNGSRVKEMFTLELVDVQLSGATPSQRASSVVPRTKSRCRYSPLGPG